MDDYRKRLEHGNSSIQVQAVWKLYQEVEKKIKGQKESTSEIVELKLLWEKCCEGDDITVKSCASALVQLVRSGNEELSTVLSGFLNLGPSAKNLSGIVRGVSELLLLQAYLQVGVDGVYTCPYQIRNPPHPFITILTNRPTDSWPLLTQEVVYIFGQENKRIQSYLISIMSPFLKFVLLEPQQSSHFSPLRNSLQRALLNIVQHGNQPIRESLISFLSNQIKLLQTNSLEKFVDTSDFVMDITLVVLSNMPLFMDSLQSCMHTLVGLINLGLGKSGYPVFSLVKTLHQVAKLSPQTVFKRDILVSMVTVLFRAPLDLLASLLSTLKLAVCSAKSSLPLMSAMLLYPILSITSLSASTISDADLRQIQALASDIINLVKDKLKKPYGKKTQISSDDLQFEYMITNNLYEATFISNMAARFEESPEYIKHWLTCVLSSVSNMAAVPPTLTYLVVSIFLTLDNLEVTNLVLKLFPEIAKKDPTQASNFLPVLLFELSQSRNPERRLAILNTIPSIVTHRFCIAPVLRTLQMLSKHPKLKPISLHLMTRLWKQQDRCFPHLYSLLVEETDNKPMKGIVDEWLVAKALAMRDVCRERPHQHGADLLSPLSEVLNKCSNVGGSVPTALALQGLYALCEAEVIDLRSAWTVLAGSLGSDKRPIVVDKVCELLSLATSVDLKVLENEAFLQETVARLWRYTQSNDNMIYGAAYRALANFQQDTFKLSHLPKQVTSVYDEEASSASEEKQVEITVDSLYPSVPGSCFTDLLNSDPKPPFKEFSYFLSTMVRREVENLPRGIYHTSIRNRGMTSNKNKAVSSIPAFIQSMYEKTKHPGLRSGLSASLLFCFDPPLESGRDGRPRQRHFIDRSKKYQHYFTTLLQEVPFQPSDWHRTMLLPSTWTSFIEKAYLAILEGRRAEVELQLRHGHIHEADGIEKQDTAWLWTRDLMTDVIKAASRGNPTTQANCVFALGGLAAVTHHYVSGMDIEDLKKMKKVTDHKSQSHWMTVAMDTIMSLMDVNFEVKGQLLGICQQLGSGERLEASSLVRSATALVFSQIAPSVISHDCQRVFQMIDMLKAGLTAQADQSSVLKFHSGLGLGMLLSCLFEEHFSDVGGTKGMTEIWKALDDLEKYALNSKEDHRIGCILGMGKALGSLSLEGRTDSRVHVQTILDKITATLTMTSLVKEEILQVLCVCVSMVTCSAYSTNIVTVDTLTNIEEKLLQVYENNSQSLGICLSLGMIGHCLSLIGQPGVVSSNEKLSSAWNRKLMQDEIPGLEKMAALTGLLALAGSERDLIKMQNLSLSENKSTASADVTKLCTQILSSHQEMGIQNTAAWLLGHLYHSCCTVTESRTGVPSSYSYLPESSVVRAVVDVLIENGTKSPETVEYDRINICLSTLVGNIKQVLPPINWTSILSPLMRLCSDVSAKKKCVQLAAQQSLNSPSAAMFLTTWVGQSLFTSLEDDCKQYLFESLPIIIKSVSPAILKKFLRRSCLQPFSSLPAEENLSLAVLVGLAAALRVTDPPEAVVLLLYETVKLLYKDLPPAFQPRLFHEIGNCLAELPDDLLDEILLENSPDINNHLKDTYIRCHLVAKGRQPIALLNGCIDAALSLELPKSKRERSLCVLQHCFYQTTGKVPGVVPRVQWILEFMGHTKNIALGILQLKGDNPEQLPKAVSFAIQSVTAAICIWSSSAAGGVNGLQANYFLSNSSGFSVEAVPDFLRILPSYVGSVENPPWDQIRGKVLDWLWEMSQLPLAVLSQIEKDTCLGALLCLRHTDDFKKSSTWTKVFSNV